MAYELNIQCKIGNFQKKIDEVRVLTLFYDAIITATLAQTT